MKYVIYKKENGIVTETTINTLVSKKPYLVQKEKCFSNVIQKNVGECNLSDIDAARHAIYIMIHDISKLDGNYESITELYNRLKSAKTLTDLLDVINLLNNRYDLVLNLKKSKKFKIKNYRKNISDIRISAKFYELLKYNPELIISIATKKIISTYYFNRISLLGKDTINTLQNLKMNHTSIETMMSEFLGETFDKTSISNGIKNLSEKIFADTLDIVYDQSQIHLCWENCSNASALQCPKVCDIPKRNIEVYKNIKSGYQIYDNHGKNIRFVVTECEKYKKAYPKQLTPEQCSAIMDSLITYHFDVASPEEANEIQKKLQKNDGIIRNKRRY